jgi:hypothetical protein
MNLLKTIKYSLVIVLISIISSTIYAQSNPKEYTLKDALKSPTLVEILKIDLLVDDLAKIKEISPKFIRINHLIINGLTDSSVDLFNYFKSLKKITINNSSEINYENLISQLLKTNNLEQLTFDECEIHKLPENFSKLITLNKLIISQSEDLDLKQVFNVLTQMPNLRQLGLPENGITSIPLNIKNLKQIKTLDLRNNYISNIPQELNKLSLLDSLFIEGNFLNTAIEDFKKAKMLNLKYLSLDSLIDKESFTELQQILPKTKIVIKSGLSGNTNQDFATLPDSVTINSKTKENKETPITYGQFQLEKTNLKIYSNAYRFYDPTFSDVKIPTYDSLLFDQRFESFNYINNFRKRSFFFFFLNFILDKVKKSGICFKFDDTDGAIQRNYSMDYNELTVYKITKWKYTGSLTKKEFKKKFIGTKKKPVLWNDVKIVPSDDFTEYSFILKADSQFVTLKGSILNDNPKEKTISLQKQKLLTKKYFSYCNMRRRRAYVVNKFIIKTKKDFDLAQEKDNERRWLEFQNMYMSEEEKKLSKKEWLVYYEKVMSDEINILMNSDANFNSVLGTLNAKGYTKGNMTDYLTDTTSGKFINANFTDSDKKLIPLNILIINKTKGYYNNLIKSKNSETVDFVLNSKDEIVIVVETVSGQIAVVGTREVKKKIEKTDQCIFNATLINKKIGTVSTVFNLLNL